ncbi:MAG TPA: MFS transporter, partial [Deinococcales bacterium]|nr:MFS transporter [Deinococcales bacterium]
MRRGTLATLLALPDFLPLAVIVLAHGAAMASAMPYITLFATQEAGMDPLRLGVFMTTIALSGIAMSAAFGRAFDRRDSRRPIVLATLVLAAAAYVALAFARDYRLLLAIAALLLGAPAAAFPQVFALAKERLDGHAERGITALRSVFSLAWVFGPPAGALLLARADFQGLYLTTAALLLLAAAPLARLRPAATVARAAPPGGNILEADAPSRPVVPVALAFAVYGMANSMAAIALPLHVTLNLGGSRADVGLLVALGALLEIPFMLAIALYPGRLPAEGLIILAFALFGAYALGAALAP